MNECWARFSPLIRSLARELGCHGADLDDATQEVLIELWRVAHRFDELKGTATTFVATIARRRFIDRLRKRRRNRDRCHRRPPDRLHPPGPRRFGRGIGAGGGALPATAPGAARGADHGSPPWPHPRGDCSDDRSAPRNREDPHPPRLDSPPRAGGRSGWGSYGSGPTHRDRRSEAKPRIAGSLRRLGAGSTPTGDDPSESGSRCGPGGEVGIGLRRAMPVPNPSPQPKPPIQARVRTPVLRVARGDPGACPRGYLPVPRACPEDQSQGAQPRACPKDRPREYPGSAPRIAKEPEPRSRGVRRVPSPEGGSGAPHRHP